MLCIRLMEGFHTEQLKVNTLDDPKRWWEVIDRTTGEVVPTNCWEFDKVSREVEIQTIPYHEYSVSFLAFLIWDPDICIILLLMIGRIHLISLPTM